MKSTKLIRLQKFIADCGVTSRRKAEDLISDGHVKINGIKVTELGTKVDPHEDTVAVKGTVIDLLTVDHLYLLMNKPKGYMCTVDDPQGRRTVMDLCKGISARVYPVGRLDYNSEGLLLLTNDGDLGQKVLHPKYEVEKVYEVKIFGRVNESIVQKLRNGINTSEGFLKPSSVRVIKILKNKTWLEFRLAEGKNREIRRICEAQNIMIDTLRRIAIGNISIDGIKPGQFMIVPKHQILKSLGMNKDGSARLTNVKYISHKKSVRLDNRRIKSELFEYADNPSFLNHYQNLGDTGPTKGKVKMPFKKRR